MEVSIGIFVFISYMVMFYFAVKIMFAIAEKIYNP